MSVFEIIDAFTFYGLDIFILAVACCLLLQLIKKLLLKNRCKKIVTFLPFVFGCILFAAYHAIVNMDIKVLLCDYVYILERGFSVGTLSTLIYVCYEQLLRTKKQSGITCGVVKTLIEGYVPTEGVDKVAEQICAAIEKDVTGDGAAKTARILLENGNDGITESDVKLLAKLIIETLAHMAV